MPLVEQKKLSPTVTRVWIWMRRMATTKITAIARENDSRRLDAASRSTMRASAPKHVRFQNGGKSGKSKTQIKWLKPATLTCYSIHQVLEYAFTLIKFIKADIWEALAYSIFYTYTYSIFHDIINFLCVPYPKCFEAKERNVKNTRKQVSIFRCAIANFSFLQAHDWFIVYDEE
jgi:hypothetical protein